MFIATFYYLSVASNSLGTILLIFKRWAGDISLELDLFEDDELSGSIPKMLICAIAKINPFFASLRITS